MIARLFPLKINFPTRLTVPWPEFRWEQPVDTRSRPLTVEQIRLLRDRRFG